MLFLLSPAGFSCEILFCVFFHAFDWYYEIICVEIEVELFSRNGIECCVSPLSRLSCRTEHYSHFSVVAPVLLCVVDRAVTLNNREICLAKSNLKIRET